MDADINSLLDSAYRLIYKKDSVCVKGSYTIASYEETLIILKCREDSLCISGESLVIASLNVDEIYINGKICSISFA